MDRLSAIIARQAELQREYGYEYGNMTNAERVATIKEMYVAAVQELGEALNETTWKPWADVEPNVHSDHLISELVDTLQFMLNMAFAARPDLSPEQLSKMLHDKHLKKVQVNYDRAANGYDGVSTKCSACGRALDDDVLLETYDGKRYITLCACGAVIYDRATPA